MNQEDTLLIDQPQEPMHPFFRRDVKGGRYADIEGRTNMELCPDHSPGRGAPRIGHKSMKSNTSMS